MSQEPLVKRFKPGFVKLADAQARNEALYQAHVKHGYSYSDLASAYGLSVTRISQIIQREHVRRVGGTRRHVRRPFTQRLLRKHQDAINVIQTETGLTKQKISQVIRLYIAHTGGAA